MRPRVLQVVTRLNIGGPAQHVLGLATGLKDRYDISVAAGVPPVEEGELCAPGVDVLPVPLVRPIAPIADIRAFTSVRGIVRDGSPALIHSHMAKAGTIARLVAPTVRPRPRTVHTFHGHVLSGYFSSPSQAAFLRIERMLARHTDILVGVSSEIRDELLELGIGRPPQWKVIPLGHDLEPFLAVRGHSTALRSELNLGSDVPLVGVLARLAPVKDHVTLLRAMRHVRGVHLAVVGDGKQRPDLEALARELGIAERVHFTGWRSDVADVIADLDVVVLTSRNEGTPVSLIEAAAAGRPVIATDVGGVRAVVDDRETGVLVPPGDERAAAKAIEWMLADRARSEELGREARRRSRERFSLRQSLDAVTALYDELVR